MIDKIIEAFKKLNEVEAILLGGSRATGTYDINSDYDLYVYLNEELTEEKRQDILNPFVTYMEYSNHFWELEDDGILINGIVVEFIYRDINDLDLMMENTVIKRNVSHGYSTCFVDNLLNSNILFDKNGRVEKLRSKYSKAITDELFAEIVEYNYPILLDRMPSLYYQLEKAVKRNDIFSINHRTTAFFEMYFDIIFAVNKRTHPGEKRLMKMASILDKTPINMVGQVTQYFNHILKNNDEALQLLEQIVLGLKTLLEKNGYKCNHRSYK